MDQDRKRLEHMRNDPRVMVDVLDESDWYTHVSITSHVDEMREDTDLADIDRLASQAHGKAVPAARPLPDQHLDGRVKAVAPLMEAALRWLTEATPGSAELLRLMEATPVPCGASAVTARRSGLYGYRWVPGWNRLRPRRHPRTPENPATLRVASVRSMPDLRARIWVARCGPRHGPVMQARASASDVPDATRPSDPRS